MSTRSQVLGIVAFALLILAIIAIANPLGWS